MGKPLISTHSSRKPSAGGQESVRYGYYVSAALAAAKSAGGWRVPAREIDAVATAQVAELFHDPLNLIDRAGLDVPADEVDVFVRKAGVIGARARARDYALLRELIVQVRVLASSVEIDVSTAALADVPEVGVSDEAGSAMCLKVLTRLTRSGMAIRLIQGGRAVTVGQDRSMVMLVARARSYWLELRAERHPARGT